MCVNNLHQLKYYWLFSALVIPLLIDIINYQHVVILQSKKNFIEHARNAFLRIDWYFHFLEYSMKLLPRKSSKLSQYTRCVDWLPFDIKIWFEMHSFRLETPKIVIHLGKQTVRGFQHLEAGGVSYSVRSVPITKGITSTGIAKILPVFKKALHTDPQTHRFM